MKTIDNEYFTNKPDICIINMNNNQIIDVTIISEQYMRTNYIQKVNITFYQIHWNNNIKLENIE